VFIRGGSILAKKMRLRRSSKLMHFDPFTLTIAPDHKNAAHGTVYLDDEHTNMFQIDRDANGGSGMYSVNSKYAAYFGIEYSGATNEIKSRNLLGDNTEYVAPNAVERIELLGQYQAPSAITLHTNNAGIMTATVSDDASVTAVAPSNDVATYPLSFNYNAEKKVVTIKVKPQYRLTSQWTIRLSY
jgi:hypothetical protein